jgi:hypothetical protein
VTPVNYQNIALPPGNYGRTMACVRAFTRPV